jgi:hypothetical protein
VLVLCGGHALGFVEVGFGMCELLLELGDLRLEAVIGLQ